MNIVGLLPVRNGERDLPEYLAQAHRWCDALVALDDGSTDETRALLEAHPMVARLLANPRRPDSRGWHDGRNRNRLLRAAAELAPSWIVSVDADERLDADDARALRGFLEGDALPGCAYGLRHYRMWGHDLHDPRFGIVWRLFAWREGLTFPDRPLHFHPVPTAIPDAARVPTTIRLRHFGAADEERMAARVEKYRQADPQGAFRIDFGRLGDPAGTPLEPWRPRPAELAPLVPIGVAAEDAPDGSAGDRGGRESKPGKPAPVRVVCLLPVRNGADDLPGWFSSIERVADAVVALDDGSTDSTRTLLEENPLVARVLTNARRDDYAGWNDAENRRRLLDAAADLSPDWILQIDADERLDSDDAAALRAFLDAGAPDAAYGMRVFRMHDDLAHYDTAGLWAYRLFPFHAGQRLPSQRLHLVPVPEEYPPERRRATTIRIQHLGSSSPERRTARRAKYREADPDHIFQTSYENLAEAPRHRRPWTPRPQGFPVLVDGPADTVDVDLHALDLDAPVLSAVVIARNDEQTIVPRLRSVVEQRCEEPFEVIVVVSGDDRTAERVAAAFPEIRLVRLDGRALPGRARNAGLRLARGDIVSFPGSHVELPPGSLQARIRAHESGRALVTGSILNGTRTRAGWASYFLDHSAALPSRPSAELNGPPGSCSYVRDFLLQTGGFPEDMRAGEDTAVNMELWRRGHRAWRAAEVTLVHHSPCATTPALMRHHFRRGRGLGRIMRDQPGVRPTLRGYVRRRLRSVDANVNRWADDDTRTAYRRARVLIVAGALAALAGARWELLRRRGAVPPVTADVNARPVAPVADVSRPTDVS